MRGTVNVMTNYLSVTDQPEPEVSGAWDATVWLQYGRQNPEAWTEACLGKLLLQVHWQPVWQVSSCTLFVLFCLFGSQASIETPSVRALDVRSDVWACRSGTFATSPSGQRTWKSTSPKFPDYFPHEMLWEKKPLPLPVGLWRWLKQYY